MNNNVPILRGDKVLFMRVPGNAPEILRLTCLSSLIRSFRPIVSTRRYFDDPFQRSDTVGLAVSYKFEMICHRGDPLHEYLADVMENRLGGDAVVTLYEACISDSDQEGVCPCTETLFSVIPEKRFYDDKGMLRYSGEFSVCSIPVTGFAAVSENGASLRFFRNV